MKYLILMTLCCSAFAADPILPDHNLTPGDIVTNSVVEISKHGYTKLVRNVPEKEKREVFIRYFGKVPDKPGNYEIDHLISLELGGANSISNLWPQSYNTFPWQARIKDKLENYLARRVREELRTNGVDNAQKMLSWFQIQIASNWTNCYIKYLGNP